jgi:hypothetical protein
VTRFRVHQSWLGLPVDTVVTEEEIRTAYRDYLRIGNPRLALIGKGMMGSGVILMALLYVLADRQDSTSTLLLWLLPVPVFVGFILTLVYQPKPRIGALTDEVLAIAIRNGLRIKAIEPAD